MRIGISVRGCPGPGFWRDAASQHAVFLAAAFAGLPFVHAVLLIDVGSTGRLPSEADAALPGLRIATPQQASDEIDVLVELAGGLDDAWLDLMRSRGCRVIACRSGAVPARSVRAAGAARLDRCDEIWLLPKDALSVPLLRMQYRCPVRVVPFVWSPMFVECRVAAFERGGTRYGYEAARAARGTGTSGWRIALFEPDVSAVTEPGIPMLACEDAWRTVPDAVSALHVLNAARMKAPAKHALLKAMFGLVRERRTTFHGRLDLVDFVGKYADAVFAHQQDHGDTYGYLDVLYGGYPLIHNSPWLLDAGYYYPGADVQQGAQMLLAALRCHDATLDAYRARSRAVFDAIDPFRDANLAAYAEALLSPETASDAP
jgi:hypothetical protein